MSEIDARLRDAATHLSGATPGSVREIRARARRRRRRTRGGAAIAAVVAIAVGAVAITSARHDPTRVNIQPPTPTTVARKARTYPDVLRSVVAVDGTRAYLLARAGKEILYTGTKPLVEAYRSRHGAVVVQQHPFDLIVIPSRGATPIVLPNKRLLGVGVDGGDDVAFVETATHQVDRPLEIVHLRDGSITATQIIVPAKKDISRVSMFGNVLVVVHTDSRGLTAVDFRHVDGTTATGFANPAGAVAPYDITTAVASPDGTRLALIGDAGQRVFVIDSRTAQVLFNSTLNITETILAGDVDYDGRWVAVSRDGTRFVDAPPSESPTVVDTSPNGHGDSDVDSATGLVTLDQETEAVAPPPPATTTTTIDRAALANVPALLVAGPSGTITRVAAGRPTTVAGYSAPPDRELGPAYRLADGRLVTFATASTDSFIGCNESPFVVSGGRATPVRIPSNVLGVETTYGAGSWHGRSVVIVSPQSAAACTRAEDFGVYVLSVADGRLIEQLPSPARQFVSLGWTSTLLADIQGGSECGYCTVSYQSLTTPTRPVPPAPKVSGHFTALVLSPDGAQLALLMTPLTATTPDWSVVVVDVATGAVTRRIPIDSTALAAPSIAFDGRWLAVGNPALASQPVRVLDTSTAGAGWLYLPGPGGTPNFDRVMGAQP
ncbi:MAG TPA: hypothetical protein VGI86_07145 [Acidimicrobiia bacterium]|jgi:hypothetical protein